MIKNDALQLRLTQYEEVGHHVPGGYYRFEVHTSTTPGWREVLYRRNDIPPYLSPNVHFSIVSDSVAYVAIGWEYAVTTDKGVTWKYWSAQDDLVGYEGCNWNLIDSIVIHTDGTGEMHLWLIDDPTGVAPLLVTTDYGLQWLWAEPPHGGKVR